MSGAVRSYTGSKKGLQSRPFRAKRRRGCFPLKIVLLLLVVGVGVYAVWSTRDTCSVARLIPTHQKYSVVFRDILGNRSKIAASRVWSALPASTGAGRVPEMLAGEIGLSDWMVNNLVAADCFVSGNDLETFGDALLVTKMSRIGALLERLHWFTKRIERDPAGGLMLRRLAEADIYYAVRGRALVVSASRPAIVRALTLREEDALGEEQLGALLAEAGAEDVRGTATFSEGDPLGAFFQYARFSMRVDATQARLTCRAMLCPEWQQRAGRLLEGVTPQQLLAPPSGMLVISADLRKPLKEVWLGVGEAMADESGAVPSLLSSETWEEWERIPTDGAPPVQHVLASLLGGMGPGFRLSWTGVDLNEIVPLPEITGTFDAPAGAVEMVLESFPAPPAEAMPWDAYPRYDAETQRLHVPMEAGPSLEPTAAAYNGGMLVSTSRTVAESLLESSGRSMPIERAGNVYVRCTPVPIVQSGVDAARLLAEAGCLKGYTAETFEEAAAERLALVGGIEEIALLLGYEDGEVTGEFTLVCSP